MDNNEFTIFAAGASARLHNLALTLCGSPADADDLVQATLERLYRAWRRTSPDNPLAYARTTLVRAHASDKRRPRWRREISSERPDQVTPHAAGESDERIVLQRALARLPVRQRQAVVLRYLEDLPLAEVAGLMRCGEGNVKKSAYDGLRNLRASLDSDRKERPDEQRPDYRPSRTAG